MKKRIAVIGTVGVPANYGGFETLAQQLVEQLGGRYELIVYCSSKAYPEKRRRFGSARLIYLPFQANGIQSVAYDICSIVSALFKADILLVLGVSGAIILPVISAFSSKKIIINIDGIEWKREKWNKTAKAFLRFSEKLAVKYAHEIIADNEGIQQHVKGSYLLNSSLIAYGADHVLQSVRSEMQDDYAFGVCRIEPENNIHIILEAFAVCGHPLKFAGNWNKSTYGRTLWEKYKSRDNIELLEPIYDQEELDKLRANCKIYIHGHSAGGTNPSLVEAMYLGLPVIAFDVYYNRATTENKAEYFKDSQDLVNKITSLDHKRRISLSATMREIAKRKYRWEIIASQYAAIIDKL